MFTVDLPRAARFCRRARILVSGCRNREHGQVTVLQIVAKVKEHYGMIPRMGHMDAVMMQLSDTVSDERGTFHALVMRRVNETTGAGRVARVRSGGQGLCRYANAIRNASARPRDNGSLGSGSTRHADGVSRAARTPLTGPLEPNQCVRCRN